MQAEPDGSYRLVPEGSRPGHLRNQKANRYLDATAYAIAERTIWRLWTIRPKQGPPTKPARKAPSRDRETRQEVRAIKQIKTVLIEVPLYDNPPGLDGTPSFCKAYVKEQLIKSRCATARNLLHRPWWGLKETGAKLANGRNVFNRNDAVVWLIEQFKERG